MYLHKTSSLGCSQVWFIAKDNLELWDFLAYQVLELQVCATKPQSIYSLLIGYPSSL